MKATGHDSILISRGDCSAAQYRLGWQQENKRIWIRQKTDIKEEVEEGRGDQAHLP